MLGRKRQPNTKTKRISATLSRISLSFVSCRQNKKLIATELEKTRRPSMEGQKQRNPEKAEMLK
jgi:hypothetical protein